MRALGLLALAVMLFFTGLTVNISFFYYLTYVLLGLLVVAYLWAWTNLEGLELERESSISRAQVGESIRERLTIYNTWPLPKLWVEVRDHSDLPSHGNGFVSYLKGRSRQRWTVRTTCTRRGKWTLGPITVHSGDPFGIFRLVKVVDLTHEVIVYPATVELPRFNLPTADLLGGQDVQRRTFQVTPNVSTVREYAPGDSFNRIHWRTTARTGKMMVKEFEFDPSADVWVVLDLDSRFYYALPETIPPPTQARSRLQLVPDNEEYMVTVAASLARHLLRLNRNVGLLADGQHREVLPPERESRQLYKILEALALVHAQGTTSLAELLIAEGHRFGRNVSLVIITSALDPLWVRSLQQMIYRGARASVVFVDPATFGAAVDSSPVLARLSEIRTPTYVISKDDQLDHALAAPSLTPHVGRAG